MAETDMVRVERDGPVTTIIIDRPEVRNAVDNATAEALAAAFRDFDADAEQRVAVFWGAGGTFCAGADLKAIASGERQARYKRLGEGDEGPMGPSRLELSKPAIAAVAGYAVAGGLELSLICDLRVAEESAVFGVFCRRWGVPLIDGGTVRLPRLVGMGRALDTARHGGSMPRPHDPFRPRPCKGSRRWSAPRRAAKPRRSAATGRRRNRNSPSASPGRSSAPPACRG